MNAAAIILCAGKGTRMGDDSKNKVCFDCAGVPTIKRIISRISEIILRIFFFCENLLFCFVFERKVRFILN